MTGVQTCALPIYLLSNAIKYSKGGQNIYFNSEISDEELKIEIIDSGIGIPLKDQAQLFTRFYRAENATNIDRKSVV